MMNVTALPPVWNKAVLVPVLYRAVESGKESFSPFPLLVQGPLHAT